MKMTGWKSAVFVGILVCVSLWHTVGCKSPDTTVAVLGVLQEGQARGRLIVTTQAALSAGVTNEFFLGAKGTTMSFAGEIDFGEANFDPLLDRVERGRAEPSAVSGQPSESPGGG